MSDGPWELPSGWRWVTLGDVAEINPRGDKPRDATDISFVGMAELDAERETARPRETRPFSEVSKGYTVFRDRDILVAKITPCWENGKIGEAILDHYFGVGSTEFHTIRATVEIDSHYLLHFLRRPEIRATGELRMTGSGGQRRVPAKYLADLAIPLPPLSEQRRIAHTFQVTYQNKKTRRKYTELLLELKNSVVSSAVHESREYTELGDCLSHITSGSRGWAKYYRSSGSKFLRINNVGDDQLLEDEMAYVDPPDSAEARRTSVKPGDVLLSITADLGRTAVVPAGIGKAHINQHLAILRPKNIRSRFLSAYLSSPYGRHQINGKNKGGTKAGLNFADIRSIKVPVLDSKHQDKISHTLQSIDTRIEMIENGLEKSSEFASSLQYRAFRGEL